MDWITGLKHYNQIYQDPELSKWIFKVSYTAYTDIQVSCEVEFTSIGVAHNYVLIVVIASIEYCISVANSKGRQLHISNYHYSVYIERGKISMIESQVSLAFSSFASTPPSFTLHADTRGGPPTNYTWTRDGQVITSGGPYIISIAVNGNTEIVYYRSRYRSTLTVTGYLPGLYQYSVTNRATPSVLTSSITIEGIYIEIGRRSVISCIIQVLLPLTWKQYRPVLSQCWCHGLHHLLPLPEGIGWQHTQEGSTQLFHHLLSVWSCSLAWCTAYELCLFLNICLVNKLDLCRWRSEVRPLL